MNSKQRKENPKDFLLNEGKLEVAEAQGLWQALKERWPSFQTELQFSTPFQYLVAVMLSAQATDQRVNQVTEELFSVAPTADALAALPLPLLERILKPLGLYRRKAVYLHASASAWAALKSVPSEREALERLPGVGRKTANLFLAHWFHKPLIAVDTHVFRVANRLGLVAAKTTLETEAALEALLPPEDRAKVNGCLIQHGRVYCKARAPACRACPVAASCRTGRRGFLKDGSA